MMTNRYLEKISMMTYHGRVQAYDNVSSDLYYSPYLNAEDVSELAGKTASSGTASEHNRIRFTRHGKNFMIINANPSYVGHDNIGRIANQMLVFEKKPTAQEAHEAMKDFHERATSHRSALGGKTPDFDVPLSDIAEGLKKVNRAHYIRLAKRLGLVGSAIVGAGGLGYGAYKHFNKPEGL